MPIYDCTPDGGGGSEYIAGDGIQIDEQTIQSKISPAANNATQIYQGGIYTPVVFQTKVSPLIVVTTNPSTPDVEITAKKGELGLSAMTNSEGVAEIEVSNFGTWTVSGTLDSELIEISVLVSESRQYDVKLAVDYPIYGAIWDGGADPKWSRTDDAELFPDPEPAVNNGPGSSPFDNIMPWSGMTRITDPVAGELVKIPKYWYKWTRSGASMQLQIASEPVDGFYVSPAHADRGDGQGERDVVYMGRYHCGRDYKSTTSTKPIVSIARDTARTNISALGAEYWQYDFAMYWTIAMLYLVEFANWNSQDMIGYGGSPDSSVFNMGLTDAMKYHTGTSAATRETYGCCQYRNIEGLWDNVSYWCDGIYFSNEKIYCIMNPDNFSDNSNGTLIGIRATSSNYISEWTNSTESGFEYALYPSATKGAGETFICDYCGFSPSGELLRIGTGYAQAQNSGIFSLYGNDQHSAVGISVGCRLQKLPNNT